jgi:tRNA (guanine-N7-)-methyltransferase
MSINKNHALPVMSKYEARWVRQEKNIYDVVVKCEEKSDAKDAKYNFLFNDFRYNISLQDIISKESYIYEDYFVHFESIYMIGTLGIIIKCAFGSFERPEHKYIILGENKLEYYPSLPIASKSNYNAHLKIKEFLDVNNH